MSRQLLEDEMVERRDMIGGGLVAGLTALLAPGAGEAAQSDSNDSVQVARALNNLRDSMESQLDSLRTGGGIWRGVGLIREQQRQWLRSTQKYPDFIEVGVNVWDNLYDWHIRYQQPLNVARLPDGRYAMVFSFTTILLRPEHMPDYVGLPYDSDPRR